MKNRILGVFFLAVCVFSGCEKNTNTGTEKVLAKGNTVNDVFGIRFDKYSPGKEKIERLIDTAEKYETRKSADKLLELVEKNDYNPKRFDQSTAELVFNELVKRNRFDILDMMEPNIKMPLRIAFLMSVMRSEKEDAKLMLMKWAIRNPNDASLIEYHPDSFNLLVDCIENHKYSGWKRARCMLTLAETAGKMRDKAIEVIEKYVEDETPVSRQSASRIGETVGGFAREALNKLEENGK